MGDNAFPWPPGFSRCTFLLSACCCVAGTPLPKAQRRASWSLSRSRTSSNGGRTGCFHRFATWRTDRIAMGGCGLREPRNPCSPFSRDDGPGCSQDGSFRKGCATRRRFGRVSSQAEAGWSVQSRNRLGVCLPDDERQATTLARNALATIQATGSEGSEDPEAGWVPYVPAHLHNFADSEQRGSEGGTGAPTSCEQPRHAGSLRSGGNAEQATGTKQTGSDGAQEGRGTGLSGPNWTMGQIANSLQVLERIGGDDGTRTRGLCRDRATTNCNYLKSNGVGRHIWRSTEVEGSSIVLLMYPDPKLPVRAF